LQAPFAIPAAKEAQNFSAGSSENHSIHRAKWPGFPQSSIVSERTSDLDRQEPAHAKARRRGHFLLARSFHFWRIRRRCR